MRIHMYIGGSTVNFWRPNVVNKKRNNVNNNNVNNNDNNNDNNDDNVTGSKSSKMKGIYIYIYT